MIIKVENINKNFKNVEILKNINVQFKSGKIYGIIGRNGSGKSVFLKLLCGFYKATSGQILFDDINIVENDLFAPNTRALIEKPNFLPELSGLENLKLLASIQNKISDDDILDVLKRVNVFLEKDKKYSKYSLGTKQKLGIAQVLMEDPDVMIFDEPLNGIENDTAKKIRRILQEEKAKGKIIIIASHIKEDIEGLADEVYELDNGFLKQKI